MKTRFLLLFILSLAIFLRFWQLTDVPPSLSHDEVAIGYNAYSILKTGKDEYGTSFPLLFRSFDDYKLPGMVYASVPSIALFGVNELGVRFPSAFFGVLAVLIFYFLVKELSKNDKLSLIATFFFSISPWHVNFSRQSFESNGAVFFLLLGTYFLLKFSKNPKNLFFVSLCYVAAIYFYYSVRLILPFIILSFLIIYRMQILKHMKIFLISALLGIILLLPLIPQIFTIGGLSRISIVSVVNDKNYIARKDEFTRIIAQNNTIINRVIYNRRIALLITAGENYLKNLSPQHIFFTGTDSFGLLYPFEIPFFILGIYYLARLKNGAKWIAIAWLISTPLVGALSTDQPNSLRTLPNAPMFALLSALGMFGLLSLLKNYKTRAVFFSGTAIIILLSIKGFMSNYFDTYPKANSLHFGDGYKQIVEFVVNNENKFDKVYISGYYWRPYIFTLFWQKYNPADYQNNGTREHFGKYYFGRATWDSEGAFFGDPKFTFEKNALYIFTPAEYEVHKNKLNKLEVIDGRFEKNVFVSAVTI